MSIQGKAINISEAIKEGKIAGIGIGSVDGSNLLGVYMGKDTTTLKISDLKIDSPDFKPAEIEVKTKQLKSFLVILTDALKGL